MIEYVDIFREEAKSLFQSFKNNDETAVARCAKVFGDKKDLTLMNIQHVIAKEYGFNQWKDIIEAQKWDLAGALNKVQNAGLSSPLKIWYGDDNLFYSTAERFGISGSNVGERLDLINFQEKWGNDVSSYIHINNSDVSYADLSKLDVSKATFDEWTIWPEDKAMMPKNFNPREFLAKRKNPGLGIRELHKLNIDGRGRNVAIISNESLRPHLEYRESLADYVDLSTQKEELVSFGWDVAIVAGSTCGVAPKAKVYCYHIDSKYKNHLGNLSQQIEAIERICALHKKLLSEGKNGIDVILIPHMMSSDDKLRKVIYDATELGIYVNDITRDAARERAVECIMYGDVNNPLDYRLHKSTRYRAFQAKYALCMVGFGQTIPCQYTIGSYLFNTTSDMMKSWQSGLFVLCRSVKPDLTPDEFWQLGIETGDFREGIGTIVNPKRLIEALRR
ncbi:MAG: hypothetical protein NC218_00370 [Acetobacter sp.]|nr:hypothetical protein [Acetobacter sp.]